MYKKICPNNLGEGHYVSYWIIPEQDYPLSALGVGPPSCVVVPGVVPQVVPEAPLGLFIMLKRKNSNTKLTD